MATEFTIHHYEDEPETMSWLLSALFNQYYSEHRGWIPATEPYSESEDGTVIEFRLEPPTGKVVVRYQPYVDDVEFRRAFKEAMPKTDLAILDLMRISRDGKTVPAGLQLIELACDKLGPDHVYVVTAYPATIPEGLGRAMTAGSLMIKPVNAVELCRKLMQNLRIE